MADDPFLLSYARKPHRQGNRLPVLLIALGRLPLAIAGLAIVYVLVVLSLVWFGVIDGAG